MGLTSSPWTISFKLQHLLHGITFIYNKLYPSSHFLKSVNACPGRTILWKRQPIRHYILTYNLPTPTYLLPVPTLKCTSAYIYMGLYIWNVLYGTSSVQQMPKRIRVNWIYVAIGFTWHDEMRCARHRLCIKNASKYYNCTTVHGK